MGFISQITAALRVAIVDDMTHCRQIAGLTKILIDVFRTGTAANPACFSHASYDAIDDYRNYQGAIIVHFMLKMTI
jgi:hypothetical protein